MQVITNKELIKVLKNKPEKVGFVDGLKISYRPVICPFIEILSLVPENGSVFDIGCGSGQFALLVSKFTQASKIAGIDIKQDVVKNAEELLSSSGPGIPYEFFVFDGSEIPEAVSDYDIVFLIDVLHHVPKHAQLSFLENIFKKMTPGAKLVLKDIDAASPFVYFNKLHDLIFAGEIGREKKVRDSIKILENIGFKIRSVSRKNIFVYPHYTILAEK